MLKSCVRAAWAETSETGMTPGNIPMPSAVLIINVASRRRWERREVVGAASILVINSNPLKERPVGPPIEGRGYWRCLTLRYLVG